VTNDLEAKPKTYKSAESLRRALAKALGLKVVWTRKLNQSEATRDVDLSILSPSGVEVARWTCFCSAERGGWILGGTIVLKLGPIEKVVEGG
jgi:hypothetical protein